jgi:hypothetical protein
MAAAHEFRDSFFDDRRAARGEQLDLGGRNIDAHDIVSAVGQACGGDAADVTQAEDGDGWRSRSVLVADRIHEGEVAGSTAIRLQDGVRACPR